MDGKTNEFKIIDGFASCRECFTTFLFRSGPKHTGIKNLTHHDCSKKDANQTTLHEVCLHLSSEISLGSQTESIIFVRLFKQKNVSATNRAELIDSIAYWYAINMCPFNCVEDPDFINVFKVLLDVSVRYGRLPTGKARIENILPCANTVKRRIQTLAGIVRSEVTTRLAAAGAHGELAFSPELWTERSKKTSIFRYERYFL